LKCTNCGVENAEEVRICVMCGEPLKRQPETEPIMVLSEEPDEDPGFPPTEEADDAASDAEKTDEPEIDGEADGSDTPEESAPSVRNKRLIILLIVLAVAAAVLMAVIVTQFVLDTNETTNLSLTTASEKCAEPATPRYPVTAYSDPTQVPEGSMDAVVGNFGEKSLTNREVNLYYWSEYRYFLNSYSSYIAFLFDTTKPLGEQAMQAGTENYTWQDWMMDAAEGQMKETHALVEMAKAQGYEMTADDKAYLEETKQAIRDYVASSEYASVTDYLCAAYGSGTTEEAFWAYLEDSIIASSYGTIRYESITYTDDEINAYYDANGYDLNGLEKDDVCSIDVRHILILPGSDGEGNEDWEYARTEAERILELWQASPTEDNFAELAGVYSEDPGSQSNGGLYTDVAPGDMVETFNDWCFDESRQPGDTGIVKTDYGYHIMYFSGRGDHPIWMDTVLDDMRTEAYKNLIYAQIDLSGYALNYEAVVLAAPTGMYE